MSNYEGMSQAELIAALAAQREENDKLKAAAKAQATRRLTLKVSEKGAVSLYGMGKFPTTMYGEQWLKVLDMAVTIREFIEANKALLSVKGEAKTA